MVCTDPARYQTMLGAGNANLVDEVLAAATSGDLDLLRVADGQLRDAVGRAGHGLGPSRGPVVTGVSSPARLESVFLCPLRVCSRYWLPIDHPGDAVPKCSASGDPLRKRVLWL